MNNRSQALSPTRGKILQTATTLFASRGYFGTSLQTLAEELGVTKAALYYYFANKEQLFLEVLQRVLADLLQKLRQAASRARSPAEALVNVLETYLSFSLEKPEAALLQWREYPPLARSWTRFWKAAQRQLREFFGELFEQASLEEQGSRRALREVMEALILLFQRPTAFLKRKQIQKVINLLLRGRI